MTRLHKLGTYKDGFAIVEYCRVCSAEGITLLEYCPGNFPDPVYDWRRVNDEPFEYAIQKGQFGDEFVKMADGSCLRRKV